MLTEKKYHDDQVLRKQTGEKTEETGRKTNRKARDTQENTEDKKGIYKRKQI